MPNRLRLLARRVLKRALEPILIPWVRRYHLRPRPYRYGTLRIQVAPGVFPPGLTLSTRILLDYLRPRQVAGQAVLELGCGTGLVALLLAGKGAHATASDINPAALANAAANAAANGLRLRTVQSDLFAELDPAEFDLVVINPPYYPRDPLSPAERAWFCGAHFDYFRALFPQLAAAGRLPEVVMILSEECALAEIHRLATASGLRLEMVARRRRMLEWHFIYRLCRLAEAGLAGGDQIARLESV